MKCQRCDLPAVVRVDTSDMNVGRDHVDLCTDHGFELVEAWGIEVETVA